jgi:hypothetical protein
MGRTVRTIRFSGFLDSSYTKSAEVTFISGEHEYHIHIFQ